ncbi:hypothetical protein Ct9H90mP29_18790 [bacterium]|nr:MAG: hypothetical protein Ct9H90mP29_18790 [bacterium]
MRLLDLRIIIEPVEVFEEPKNVELLIRIIEEIDKNE